MKRKEIDTVFERYDPAVEQVTWAHLLSSKVIDQQNTAVGFHLEGCFIKLMHLIINQIKTFQCQLATYYNEWPPNFYPAWIASLAGPQIASAASGRSFCIWGKFMAHLIVNFDHLPIQI